MRPLWDRYYADTDAIIYVVNSSDTCFSNLLQSRREFEKMCNNEVLKRRIESGLPILIFANKLDMAYREYDLSVQRANNKDGGENGNSTSCSRGISWNPDEEDNFVGGDKKSEHSTDSDSCAINDISQRVVNFNDLVALFGLQSLSPQPAMNRDSSSGGGGGDSNLHAGSNVEGNIFLFGGSAKTGEGVRAAMEYLVAYSKRFHLDKQPRQ